MNKYQRAVLGVINPWGSYFVNLAPHARPTGDKTLIFGRVLTLDEIRERERALGVDDVELDATLDRITEAHRKGWRFTESFSLLCPEGEFTSAHVSTLEPVDPETYEYVKDHGWNVVMSPRFVRGKMHQFSVKLLAPTSKQGK